ncbi:signal peptidase I [Treponema zioleckii]|uniref:signal peptidase I n=1 Tax=Treponema zioleckii TaxID=331680 RepID=UPI001F5C061D|nr:signal peptidase I [Treponema zioleckii]
MTIKKFGLLTKICLGFSCAFALSTISFHADISLAAFPLSLIFTLIIAFSSIKKLLGENNLNFIAVVRELLQYEPYVLLVAFVLRRAGDFGTPHILDSVSVLLWLVTSVLTLVLLHYLNPKNVGKLSDEWKNFILDKKYSASKKKAFMDALNSEENEKLVENESEEKSGTVILRTGAKKVVFEILSWVDALVQAVFMVLLLNIFVVQLYEIPSESMVPEFLVKDRVVVFKTLSGPKFPLSDIGLPSIRSYKRGDIVVFRNPHYKNDRKSEVRTFVSQLVYMCTLTKVNLNVDETGEQKADPLVKRITGVPGEQLMMQDGILYSRTKDSEKFEPVEDDSSWAAWNLNEVKDSLKNGINDFPVSQEQFETLLRIESERKALDYGVYAFECEKLASAFDEIFEKFKESQKSSLKIEFSDREMLWSNIFRYNEAISLKLLTCENGATWFRDFMTNWIGHRPNFNDDLYSEANYKLNLMLKLTFGKLICKNAELHSNKVPRSSWASSFEVQENLIKMNDLCMYIFYMDNRNMPIFPANTIDGAPQYIPENSYFMMGDNRFNSLDMRHSYEKKLVKVAPDEKYSVTYESSMEPQYVGSERILGKTSYRFWPYSRKGVPGHTGK